MRGSLQLDHFLCSWYLVCLSCTLKSVEVGELHPSLSWGVGQFYPGKGEHTVHGSFSLGTSLHTPPAEESLSMTPEASQSWFVISLFGGANLEWSLDSKRHFTRDHFLSSVNFSQPSSHLWIPCSCSGLRFCVFTLVFLLLIEGITLLRGRLACLSPENPFEVKCQGLF